MPLSSSPPKVTAPVLDDEQDTSLFRTCPMCHTPTSLMQSAIDAGADWRCVRCGQHWDAARLSAVAAYDAWVVERAAVGAEGGERASRSHQVPIEQLGGTT